MLIHCYFSNRPCRPVAMDVGGVPAREDALQVKVQGQVEVARVLSVIHHVRSEEGKTLVASVTACILDDCYGSIRLYAEGGASKLFQEAEETVQRLHGAEATMKGWATAESVAPYMRALIQLLELGVTSKDEEWASQARSVGLNLFNTFGGSENEAAATEWMRVALSVALVAAGTQHAPARLSMSWSGIGTWLH